MKVVIIGVGQSAMTTADILVADHNFSVAGFIGISEENKIFSGKKVYSNIPYLGDRSILKKIKDNDVVGFIAAIGNRYLREDAYYEASLAGLAPINAISKNANYKNEAMKDLEFINFNTSENFLEIIK